MTLRHPIILSAIVYKINTRRLELRSTIEDETTSSLRSVLWPVLYCNRSSNLQNSAQRCPKPTRDHDAAAVSEISQSIGAHHLHGGVFALAYRYVLLFKVACIDVVN